MKAYNMPEAMETRNWTNLFGGSSMHWRDRNAIGGDTNSISHGGE